MPCCSLGSRLVDSLFLTASEGSFSVPTQTDYTAFLLGHQTAANGGGGICSPDLLDPRQ